MSLKFIFFFQKKYLISTIHSGCKMKDTLTDCFKLFLCKPAIRSCVAQKFTLGKILFNKTQFYKILYCTYL